MIPRVHKKKASLWSLQPKRLTLATTHYANTGEKGNEIVEKERAKQRLSEFGKKGRDIQLGVVTNDTYPEKTTA